MIRDRLDKESDTLVVFPFWLSVMFKPLGGSQVPICVTNKQTIKIKYSVFNIYIVNYIMVRVRKIRQTSDRESVVN